MVTERRPQPARRSNLLVGQRLADVRLGPAIVLGFSGGSQVLIETVARLQGPDGGADIDPGGDPSDALAPLLGDVVRTADIGGAGELRITFGNGAELVVRADSDLESWAVAGPDGFLIVCLADGELAVWGDERLTLGAG